MDYLIKIKYPTGISKNDQSKFLMHVKRKFDLIKVKAREYFLDREDYLEDLKRVAAEFDVKLTIAEYSELPLSLKRKIKQFSVSPTNDQEFQNLMKELQSLKNEHQSLRDEHRSLKDEHHPLKDDYQSLKGEFQSLNTNHEVLKDAMRSLWDMYLNLADNPTPKNFEKLAENLDEKLINKAMKILEVR